MTSSTLLKKIYKTRPTWSKKGDFGKLLVVGGSVWYSGSPIFNALSAYRAGCDLVKTIAPKKAARAIKAYAPDLIAYPVDAEYFGPAHAKLVFEMQKEADAMVIGGGLGRNPKTLSFVRSVLKKTNIPTVVDADAIHAVNSKLKRNFIVTPHTREFFVLSGKKVGTNIEERKKAAKDLAKKLECAVLLKGHVDVISDGTKTATNNSGSPFMTKGGFGDTLAGICGALLARGCNSYDAACTAAYINGAAGQKAAKKFGEGTLASDLMNEIPNVIKRIS